MSQSSENKVAEGVVESTLSKSNILEKIAENKKMLYLSVGLLGCIALYKNRNNIVNKFKSFYKKSDDDNA